jgi:type IV pilus assembly protein PilY1
LQGNVWRFDANTGAKLKFAVLKDASGNVQPITARPELGMIGGKRVVFVGTGKYLETSDLTTTAMQTIYAIRDSDATTTFDNPRTKLKKVDLVTSGSTRSATVDRSKLPTECCWFADFPDSGERVNIDMRLNGGILLVPTTVPSNTVCEPGGYGWLNYFDYATGEAVTGSEDSIVSQRFSAPIVGTNVFRLPDGKRITTVVTANRPTPEKPPKDIGTGASQRGFQGRRVIWRELIPGTHQ